MEKPLYESNLNCVHDDWDIPVAETCVQKSFEQHIYLQKSYNYILEYDFYDGNSGFGYCYILDYDI